MKTVIPLGFLLLLSLLQQAQPVRGAPFNLRDPVEEGLTLPESKIIDFENLTESERREFLRENVNITALKIQQRVLREKQNMNRTTGPMAITQSTTDRNVSERVKTRKEYAEHIIGNIKHNIEHNLMRNDTTHLAVTHEMAFSAVCDMPKNTNASQWNGDHTWNLFFRLPHNKQYNSVTSAVLRLYMNGANSTGARESDNCKNPSEQMIRITASVYFRKNRKDNASQERQKKSVCSCITITRSYRGWITMDTLLAVKAWDKPNRNLGIAIDVEDQDDRPLKAADFFAAPDCSEASKPHEASLPWSYLRSTFAGSDNEMDNVPHTPRIDITAEKGMHHNHRPYRNKHHYARYQLEKGSSVGSGSTGNSYEHDDRDAKCPHFVSNDTPTINREHHHQQHHHHSQRPHPLYHLMHHLQTNSQHFLVQHPVAINKAQMKRRHLNHRTSAGEESDDSRSASSASVLSGEERNL